MCKVWRCIREDLMKWWSECVFYLPVVVTGCESVVTARILTVLLYAWARAHARAHWCAGGRAKSRFHLRLFIFSDSITLRYWCHPSPLIYSPAVTSCTIRHGSVRERCRFPRQTAGHWCGPSCQCLPKRKRTNCTFSRREEACWD